MEKRQHDVTRRDNKRMKDSVRIVREYLKSHTRRKLTETKIAKTQEHLNFLEHVLEFSATWNGVPTKHFFPDDGKVCRHLESRGLLRLGELFAKPFAEISAVLREAGAEYPLLLKKLYEVYYLRLSISKRTVATLIPEA